MNFLHLLPLALFALAAESPPGYDAAACNQSPSLCTKPYNSILQLGAHNSAFVRTAANSYQSSANQYFNATIQLSAGVRLLQSQIHLDKGSIKLCHTSCLIFDAGTLDVWFAEIAGWMKTHPSEVVTLLLVNDEKIPPAQLKTLFDNSGLGALAFTPSGTGWPTLGEMVGNDTRLVTFLSEGADVKAAPYLLPEFDYVFETPFETFGPDKFSCMADRPGGVAGKESTTPLIPLMNRFFYDVISEQLKLYISNSTYSSTLNSDQGVGNLADGVATCQKSWGGRSGGYVLLDFVNDGSPMAVVDRVNNVTKAYNRAEFPENPEKAQAQAKQDKEMGWSRIEKLSTRAREGGEVKAAEWVFYAGNWAGSL